jgi:hypothetical protein
VWAPGWASHNVQFVELPSERSIDWTPHQSASRAGVGYVWIEEAGRLPDLDRDGVPLVRPPDLWDPDLGWRIPVPENTRGHCSCGRPEGCSHCRTRLNLTFWVHNTTLDLHKYRVDLSVWTPNVQWAMGQAHRTETVRRGGRDVYPCFHPSYPEWFGDRLPCPLPRQIFEIPARRDPSDGPAGRHAHEPDWQEIYDWQPFGWSIDFTKRQLSYDQIYGIRLMLTCTDNYRIQDIKQLWFKTQLR